MLLETLGLVVAIVASLAPWRALPDPPRFSPVFRSSERAVDNWRREGALNLDVPPEQAMALALGREIKGLSRCVRLNNYWCVKKAGWTGEIASDADGHVAFASAADGAAVAAGLLRRYYVEFNLHSARAIVRRWAPAQCGPVASARLGNRMFFGREPSGLTMHGLGATLRARWLARQGHGRIRGIANARIRRSVVPNLAWSMMKTPTIAAGIGTMESASRPVRLAMLPYPGVAIGPAPGARPSSTPPPSSAASCASETLRIASYAAHIAEGVAGGPDADLALFDADGRPTPNFAKALFNMAAVEIGPLRARQSLVDAAIAAALAQKP